MRRFAIPLLLLLGGCLMGCASGPKNFDDGLKMVTAAIDAGEKSGASWYVDASWTGSPGLEFGYFGRFNSGIAVRLYIQGNAQTAAGGEVE